LSQLTGNTGGVSPAAAPRIDHRLLGIIERGTGEAAADLTRTIGAAAEALGLARPSYEQVRTLLRRAQTERSEVTTVEVLLEIALRTRPAYDLRNWLYGDALPWRPGAHNEQRRK